LGKDVYQGIASAMPSRRQFQTALQFAEKCSCSLNAASAANAGLILGHLWRGLKPPPFKTRSRAEFFRSLLTPADDPRQWGKPLHEQRGLLRYRVGDYRLICYIQDEKITVLVLEVGHRKDVRR
jgi:mRNA interferase RelE/StbE